MEAKNIIYRNIVLTFIIGLIAGVAPFLCLRLVPAIMNPDYDMGPINFFPIILTGILVGAITSILFSKKLEETEPRDVFFYALGIPAILIATVSNLSTEFNSMKKIAYIKETASIQISSTPQPETIKEKLTPIQLPKTNISSNINSRGIAWADDMTRDHRIVLAQVKQKQYIVVIGEYNNVEEAQKDYFKYNNTKLKTETYIPKNLIIFKTEKNTYILAYSTYPTLKEAQRAYKLMMINEPNKSVRIIEY